MKTPTHISVNLAICSILVSSGTVLFLWWDVVWCLASELIDLDHLFAKPIYHLRRNSFKAHPIHANWKLVAAISLTLLFHRMMMFLGIALLSHLLLDYIDAKKNGV